MRAGVAEALGALSMLVAIGCGGGDGSGGPPPRTITAADVTPIPPGTAIGALFAGDYVVTGGSVEACYCRIGSCGTVRVLVGTTLTLVETDGALQITTGSSSNPCAGGIDDDGSFTCNGQVVEAGDIQYAVASGKVLTANGQPVSLHDTEEVTAAITGFDCDFRGTLTAQYSGPPTTFAASKPPVAGAIGFSLLGP